MSASIIYLEDDEALAQITVRSLQKKSFTVYHAATINDFKNLLIKISFTHALLDLKIGNDTSLALIKDIKDVNDVPIVVLTGYGTIRTAVQAMKLGAINFLSKPCGVNEIVEAFKESEHNVAAVPTAPLLTIEKPSLKALEWENIQKAIDDNHGNISAAARQLKMHRRTLQRKLEKRHLE